MTQITSRWYRQHVSEHTDALSAPQRFPLTDDGSEAGQLTKMAPTYGPDREIRYEYETPGRVDSKRLATARYRDWIRRRIAPS